MVLRERDRLEVTPVVRGEVELVPLAALLGGLGVTQQPDRKGGLVLRHEGRQVTLYQDKSLASVGGELRLLSSNVVVEGVRWLVPVESVARILGPLLAQRVEYRASQRALILGNVRLPRVNVGTSVSGDSVRLVFEASEKVPFRVRQEGGRVTVAVGRDVIDAPQAHSERLTGGIVDLVQFTGGRDNVFTITLGRRFQGLQQQEQDTRLVLDFMASPAGTASASPGAAATPPPPARARDLGHAANRHHRPRSRRRGGGGEGPGRNTRERRHPVHRAQGARGAREHPGGAGLPHP